MPGQTGEQAAGISPMKSPISEFLGRLDRINSESHQQERIAGKMYRRAEDFFEQFRSIWDETPE
jgi:hypothetical protein